MDDSPARIPVVTIVGLILLIGISGVGTSWADTQVNSYTTSHQLNPSVAMDANGDFVIVWQSHGSAGTDSSFSSIQGKIYASDGTVVQGEFQVNSYTTSIQRSPAVALAADGDFVVVWRSHGSVGSDSESGSIQAQLYASDGSAVGSQFQINSFTTSGQETPAVGTEPNGDFVVVWRSYGSVGSDSSGFSIQGQRYASDGSTAGGQFQVNTYTTGEQGHPELALAADGDFVVVWDSDGSFATDTSEKSVQGQRFASDGAMVGGQFQINTSTTYPQTWPSIGMDPAGNFVVAWINYGPKGYSYYRQTDIRGQRYASDGTAVAGEFEISDLPTPYVEQRFPSVAFDSDGDFVVAWSAYSYYPYFSIDDVLARRFASDGASVGDHFQVNARAAGDQWWPSVAVNPDGAFLVVWHSSTSEGTDTSGLSIQRTNFELFADGFESGDTSSW